MQMMDRIRSIGLSRYFIIWKHLNSREQEAGSSEVHGREDPEEWDGEGGGRGVQDGEHM